MNWLMEAEPPLPPPRPPLLRLSPKLRLLPSPVHLQPLLHLPPLRPPPPPLRASPAGSR